ncbi:MAG: dockerin type I repeat-containing protein [Ruminococcus sp.]|nr:dockerin type I repeat-containing protein [Ruminococcus sp.]
MKKQFLAFAMAAMCLTSAVTVNNVCGNVVAADSDTTAAQTKKKMTLDDVKELSKKGKSLDWSDLDVFEAKWRNAVIYSRFCKFDLGDGFFLVVGGEPDYLPETVWLCYSSTENYVDVKTGDVSEFISKYAKEDNVTTTTKAAVTTTSKAVTTTTTAKATTTTTTTSKAVTTTTTAKATTTTTVSEMPVTLKGDANCDGQVDMSDVVLVMQALANPNRYDVNGTAYVHLTPQGKINADMDGFGMTVNDALTIQRKLLGLENENSFDASGIVTFEMEPTKTGVEEFLANNTKIANDYKEDELYNITPSAITEKFGFTVFKFTKSCESYVVYKDKTYLLESSFGGPGTISFAAADLNKDGNYELYFTFSYGSGMNHAEVSCFDTSEDTEFYFCSDYFNDDMTLAVENGKLCVYKAAYKDSGSFVHIKTELKEKIGEIVYEYGVIRFKRTDIEVSDEMKVELNTTIPQNGSKYVEMKPDKAMVSSYDVLLSSLNGVGVWFQFESPKYPVTVSTENGKFRIYNYQGGGLGSINDVGKTYTVGRIGEVCFAPENVRLPDDYKAEVKVTGEENGKTVDLGTLVITKNVSGNDGLLSATFKSAAPDAAEKT